MKSDEFLKIPPLNFGKKVSWLRRNSLLSYTCIHTCCCTCSNLFVHPSLFKSEITWTKENAARYEILKGQCMGNRMVDSEPGEVGL